MGETWLTEMDMGINTAYDFASRPEQWVVCHYPVPVQRTWMELNGIDCVPNEAERKKKSICTSRSFNGMVTDLETLRTHTANYAASCAQKLRQQAFHDSDRFVGGYRKASPLMP